MTSMQEWFKQKATEGGPVEICFICPGEKESKQVTIKILDVEPEYIRVRVQASPAPELCVPYTALQYFK